MSDIPHTPSHTPSPAEQDAVASKVSKRGNPPNLDTSPNLDTLPNLDKVPGHWLLARLGKRVLRPGGRELTGYLLAKLNITPGDDIVEFAPGLGVTTRDILERQPASYTGVEQNAAAVAVVNKLLGAANQRCLQASAQDSELPANSADVVMGEAFLTMQSPSHKAKIVAEAFRILRPGGRYGLHELCLRPDDMPLALQDDVRRDLAKAIRVNAQPLTVADWRALVTSVGFEVEAVRTVDMGLLRPKRLIQDEGLAGVLRIVFNVLRKPAARRRVLTMRATFQRHAPQLGAVGLVARKPLD